MVENSEQELKERNEVKEEVKELGDTYRKFLRLYEKLVADRLIVVKQGETLCKIIDELKAETNLATEFKVHVRRDVVDTIRLAVAETNKRLKESIRETVAEEFNVSLEELKTETKNSIEVLKRYNEKTEEKPSYWSTYLIIFMGIMVFIATMYTAVKVRRYIPNSYLTRDQLEIYHNGMHWETLWRKISKDNRDRIVDLVVGKLPAEKGSIDWIEKNNPKLSWSEVKKRFNEQKE